MVTARTRANGLGHIDPERMAQTVALLSQTLKVERDVAPTEIYTGAHLSRILPD